MNLIEIILNPPFISDKININFIKKFSPEEIREAIQSLVADDNISLASELGNAGISIYPESEPILAICGLLAMINENWQNAVEILGKLIEIQGENATPFNYTMLVRALRCNQQSARALRVARKGLEKYPNANDLIAEKIDLESRIWPSDLVAVNDASTNNLTGKRDFTISNTHYSQSQYTLDNLSFVYQSLIFKD